MYNTLKSYYGNIRSKKRVYQGCKMKDWYARINCISLTHHAQFEREWKIISISIAYKE